MDGLSFRRSDTAFDMHLAAQHHSVTATRETEWRQKMETEKPPLHLGQVVELLPEYQDPGDAAYTWVVVEVEDRGRLVISPTGTGMRLSPRYAVEREWLRVPRDVAGGASQP